MPTTSCAPRFAPMKPSAQIHAGSERPDSKKSELVFIWRRITQPMAITKMKYNARIR